MKNDEYKLNQYALRIIEGLGYEVICGGAKDI